MCNGEYIGIMDGYIFLDITKGKWELPDLTEKIMQMKNKFYANHVIIEEIHQFLED